MKHSSEKERYVKILNQITYDYIVAVQHFDEFFILYKKNESQAQIMNYGSTFFFENLHNLYWDYFILSVSRFTDPYKDNNNNKNLSINYFLDSSNIYTELETEKIESLLAEIKSLSKPFRKVRSKEVGHRDLSHALTKDRNIDLNMNDLQQILFLIGSLLNYIHSKVSNTEYGWHIASMSPSSRILLALKDGMILNELKINDINTYRHVVNQFSDINNLEINMNPNS